MIRPAQTLALALALGALAPLAACQSPGRSAAASNAAREGAAFLAANAHASGVQSAGGIEYQVLVSGPSDGAHPTPQDEVVVEYEGRLLNGKVFDATPAGQPASFQLGGLIPGWITAMQLMRPGDEWMIWIPPDLAYGGDDSGPIPANSTLAFRLKLVAVHKAG
ncbi:MAG TPA: FKBP-type peptidyl-prolyl cis-trans isomerase [Caulobacteraceae bacterium]|jgi:peptidylprolyl isomerase/FKBP-type peptidyl-prolyl cis-trans isomerase FklB|nr:FKBP-type peptidyl-prolyl cis-trans isomerase [Caulobacteraceae bacterium]